MRYRTYLKSGIFQKELFKPITNSSLNKPFGGLWGCRGTEWYDWCCAEDFPCSDYFIEWKPKNGAKIYSISCPEDFYKLCRKYPFKIGNHDFSIDYEKMQKDYDGVEVLEDAIHCLDPFYRGFDSHPKDLYFQCMIGLNAWDVPSIVMFNIDSFEIVSNPRRENIIDKANKIVQMIKAI